MDNHPALKSAVYAVLTAILIALLFVMILCAPAFAGPISRLLS